MNYIKLLIFFLGILTNITFSFANTPFMTIPDAGNELVYSFDGQSIISTNYNSIKFFNTKTGGLEKTLSVSSIPLLQNKRYYVKYNSDYSFHLFKSETKKLVKEFSGFSDYQFTKNEKDFYFSNSIGERLKEKRKKSGNEMRETHAVALTPNGKYLAACSKSNKFRLKIWDTNSGNLIKEINISNTGKAKINRDLGRGSSKCTMLVSNKNGEYFFASDSKGGLYLISSSTGNVLSTPLIDKDWITAAAIGNEIIVAINSSEIIVWNVKNNTQIKSIKIKDRKVDLITVSSDENLLAYFKDGKIRILDINTKNLIRTLVAFDSNLPYRAFSISFSPDNKFIASSDAVDRGKIKIWETSFDNIINKHRNIRLPGIVYKSKHFWQIFIGFDEMQNVFNGYFGGLEKKIKFKLYYHAFVNHYDYSCKLVGNTVSRKLVRETVTEQDGIEVSRKVDSEVVIQMEKRFADKYDEYYDAVYSYSKLKGFGLALQQKLPDIRTMPEFQITNFFRQASCGSATMLQMKENLWRVSHGKSSLQKQGVKIPHAKAESDSIQEVINAMTLYEACRDNNGSKDYCSCFDNKAKVVMTKEEITYFSNDFSSYYREVTGKMDSISRESDLWRLYEPHRSGLRCN